MKNPAIVLVFVLLAGFGCMSANKKQQMNAEQSSAPQLMIQYGCPTCHVIPGVPGAVGKVGPSLDSLAQRSFIAGVLPNSPTNLEHWIMHPQKIDPGAAMPEMGVTQADAKRISAFLQGDR